MTQEQLEKAERMYIEGDLTLRQLSAKTGIGLSQLNERSRQNLWVEKRREWRIEHGIAPGRCNYRKGINWTPILAEYFCGQKTAEAIQREYGIASGSLNHKIEACRRQKENIDSGRTAADETTKAASMKFSVIPNWVLTRYITGNESASALAKETGYSYTTLKGYLHQEHAYEKRKAFQREQLEALESSARESALSFAQKLAAINMRMLDKVDAALDQDKMLVKDIYQLSKTLLNAEETHHRLSGRMRPVEEAMAAAAMKRAENAASKFTDNVPQEIKWSEECRKCAE